MIPGKKVSTAGRAKPAGWAPYGLKREIYLQKKEKRGPGPGWENLLPGRHLLRPAVYKPGSAETSFGQEEAPKAWSTKKRESTGRLLRLNVDRNKKDSPLFKKGSGLPRHRVEPEPPKKRKRDLTDDELNFHHPISGEWPLIAGVERLYSATETQEVDAFWRLSHKRADLFLEAQREEQRIFTDNVCNATWQLIGKPVATVSCGTTATIHQARTFARREGPVIAARVDDSIQVTVKYGKEVADNTKRRCLQIHHTIAAPTAHLLKRIKLYSRYKLTRLARSERFTRLARFLRFARIAQQAQVVNTGTGSEQQRQETEDNQSPEARIEPARRQSSPSIQLQQELTVHVALYEPCIVNLGKFAPEDCSREEIRFRSTLRLDQWMRQQEWQYEQEQERQQGLEVRTAIREHFKKRLQKERPRRRAIQKLSSFINLFCHIPVAAWKMLRNRRDESTNGLLSSSDALKKIAISRRKKPQRQSKQPNVSSYTKLDDIPLKRQRTDTVSLPPSSKKSMSSEQSGSPSDVESKNMEQGQRKPSPFVERFRSFNKLFPGKKLSTVQSDESSSRILKPRSPRDAHGLGPLRNKTETFRSFSAQMPTRSGQMDPDRPGMAIINRRSLYLPRNPADALPSTSPDVHASPASEPRARGNGVDHHLTRSGVADSPLPSKSEDVAPKTSPGMHAPTGMRGDEVDHHLNTSGVADSSSLSYPEGMPPTMSRDVRAPSSSKPRVRGNKVDLRLNISGDVDPSLPRISRAEDEVELRPRTGSRSPAVGEVERADTFVHGGEAGDAADEESLFESYHEAEKSEKSEKEPASLSNLHESLGSMQISSTQATNTRRSVRLQTKELQKKESLAKKRRERDAAEEDFKTAQREFEELAAPDDPVLPTLDKEWITKLKAAMDQAPSRTTELATSLTKTALNRHAFGTCLPRVGDSASAWLNDEIILAYLEHIVAYGKGETKNSLRPKQARDDVPRYASFNPQFWSKLESQGPASVARWPTRIGLKGDRLLEAELVFIPVNNGVHWTLMALYPRRRQAAYYDSMGNKGSGKENTLRSFLEHHLKEKYVADEWHIEIADSPQQTNSSDCGVFTITTARMLALGWDPKQSYASPDIYIQRQRILCELMNGGFHGDFEPYDALVEPMVKMARARAEKERLEAEISNDTMGTKN